MMILFLAFFLLQSVPSYAVVSISNTPVCTVRTTNSILEQKENYTPYFIGYRKRWATCTGAAWLDDHLFVLNLYGQKISTYRFHSSQNHFELVHEISNSDGVQLTNSENLVVSPDASLLALCSDGPNAGVKIYSIDAKKHAIEPIPIFMLKTNELVHNVRFTPDGAYLAITTWDNNASISIYKIVRGLNTIDLTCVYQKVNESKCMVVKGINFTKDGKFAVVVYSVKAGEGKKIRLRGFIAIHKFDHITGKLGKPICSVFGRFCCEDVVFLNNDNAFVCSDQNNDSLTLYPFNPITGKIGSNVTTIQGPETKLSFPHGLALTPDGSYLVVTNYGDDTFSLYQVNK